jgi:hypothetical protein
MFKLNRRWLVGGSLLAAGLAVAGSLALAEALRYAKIPTRIAIDAIPIASFDNRDPAQLRFGDLLFRGGLALTSKAESFGGISALNIAGDGAQFLAITDNGSWLRGRFVYEKGKLVGVTDAEMAPILAADGKPLAAQGRYDVESLTELDGQHYIGIERVEQIVRLDYRRDGLLARGTAIPVPPDFKTFDKNKSLECLAAAPKNSPLAGNLIVITEESLDSAGNHRSFLMKPDGSQVERFSVKRSDDYDVTDCTILPPGDLLILERRFSPARGVAMRIRRIPLTAIKPGALVDGRILIDADMAFQVDNMEGIAVHRTAEGETVITLVSDDNFSVIQRNLLLQFTLVE